MSLFGDIVEGLLNGIVKAQQDQRYKTLVELPRDAALQEIKQMVSISTHETMAEFEEQFLNYVTLRMSYEKEYKVRAMELYAFFKVQEMLVYRTIGFKSPGKSLKPEDPYQKLTEDPYRPRTSSRYPDLDDFPHSPKSEFRPGDQFRPKDRSATPGERFTAGPDGIEVNETPEEKRMREHIERLLGYQSRRDKK